MSGGAIDETQRRIHRISGKATLDFWGLALTLGCTCACEKLAGIEKKELLPAVDAAASSLCAASNDSGIGLRVANMIPSSAKLDICVRPAGGTFPSSPMLQASDSCPAGVAYGQYTIALNVAPGTYDVKLVQYGSDCNSDGPVKSGVTVSSAELTSVVAYGSDVSSANATLAALQDETSADTATSANIYMRFFHALSGEGVLDAGLVDPTKSPPTMSLRIFPNVNFGSIAAAGSVGTVTVNALGYMIYPSISSDVGGLTLGASHIESGDTPFVYSIIGMTKAHRYTLFLIGAAGQKEYPAKMWSCDETMPYGFFAACGDPRAKVFGIFHPNLTDIFTDYIHIRTPAALEAIHNSSADVLCLPELYSPEIRQQLADKLNDTTGMNIVFSDDAQVSSASDLTDQNGNTPVYNDPPCSGDLQSTLLDFETCLLSPSLDYSSGGCIAATDGGLHHFASDGSLAIGCAAQACATPVNTFLAAGSHDSDACYMCAIAHLSSGESIEDMYSKCTTGNGGKPHYVYDGYTGIAVLSKLPIANGDSPEVVLLPASTWNRAALRVPLLLPNNAVIDFWCASIRAPNSEVFLPNGGPYYGSADAGGANAEPGNAAEQNLQITRLIEAVNGRASASQTRAIVAALTYASPLITDARGNTLITDLVPENFALFEQQIQQQNWSELVPANYQPQCTYCGDNPLNGGSADKQWTEHIFGVRIDPYYVTDTQRTFTSTNDLQLVPYNSQDNQAIPVPVSQYYGLQSTVRVTQ